MIFPARVTIWTKNNTYTHLFCPIVIQLRQHSKKHYSPRYHQWSRHHHHHRHRGTHGHHAYECGGPEMQSLINVRLYCCLTQRVNGFSSWYSFLLLPPKKDDGHITEHTSRLDNSTFSFLRALFAYVFYFHSIMLSFRIHLHFSLALFDLVTYHTISALWLAPLEDRYPYFPWCTPFAGGEEKMPEMVDDDIGR